MEAIKLNYLLYGYMSIFYAEWGVTLNMAYVVSEDQEAKKAHKHGCWQLNQPNMSRL